MIGTTIDGRYRILRVLGEGGMGAVYEAEHTGTGHRFALKVIHAQMAGKTEMVTRFQREARAAGSIETPHIVQVFDAGTDPSTGVIYMAMELLRGEDVQHLLKRLGQLPLGLALRLVGQACIGLGKAHGAGVVHRDIKPANLFLSRLDSGEIILKVVDFGIAKMVDPVNQEETGLTATGGLLGSPLYMSPEQAKGRKTIDHRTDIWSLGVVLYKALTGQVPHAGHDTVLTLMMALCTEPAPPIQDLAPWVPPEVARIVHRMLARAPDERFPSMAAVLEALQPHLPGGLSMRADDLVSVSEEEQAHLAPRAVLEGDGLTVREGPAEASGDLSKPAKESTKVVTAGGSSAQAISASSERSSASAEAGLSVSQGAAGVPSRSRSSRLRLVMALPLVLGLGGFALYELSAHPAAVASSSEHAVSAPTPSAETAPVTVTAPLSEERTVRLAVAPADATVEIDGRAVQVHDGVVELRGALGSVHHVRLAKGSQETKGEIAITSQGAVPPRVQVEAEAQKPPLTPLKAPAGTVNAGRALPTASPAKPPASKPSGPAPAEKFE